jgi:hypothetical protein
VNSDQNKIEKMAIDLYPFAYSLYPDELMAGQLIVDGLMRMIVDENLDATELKLKDLPYLCLSIFALAKSRKGHLLVKNEDPFYQELPLHTRAVLFLKEKWRWNHKEIECATGLSYNEVVLSLHEGRGLLFSRQESLTL